MTNTSVSQKSSGAAVAVSALVCPGAGQFMQRRPIIGALFLSTFLLFFAVACHRVALAMHQTFQFALTFADAGSAEAEPDIARIFPPLLAALGVYAVNVVDVVAAHRRLHRRAQEAGAKAAVMNSTNR